MEQRPKEAAHGTKAMRLKKNNGWWPTEDMWVVHIHEEAIHVPGYQLGPDVWIQNVRHRNTISNKNDDVWDPNMKGTSKAKGNWQMRGTLTPKHVKHRHTVGN